MAANQQIKRLIEALDITPNAFASKLGIKATSVYNILNDKNKPSYDLLEKIIATFSVNPNWILQDRGDVFYNKNGNSMQGDFAGDMQGSNENFNKFDVDDFMEKHFPESEMKELDKQWNLLTKIIKTNKEEDVTNCYENIYCSIELLKSYLEHYDVYYNMTGVIEDLRKKKVGIDVVIKEFKEKIAIEKELYKIIEPYADVINEIYNKVSDFNEMHDRLYCYDNE